ncbi:RAB24 protein, partial [Uria aalge]|nr:RAB24 protein [Uria aalge]
MSGRRVDAKVVLLGQEGVGKSSLVERCAHGRFRPGPYQNTIGAAFVAKVMSVGEQTVTLGIWDTAGSERYEAMSRIYYRGARAAVVCFGKGGKGPPVPVPAGRGGWREADPDRSPPDLTDSSSFQRAKFWVNELQNCEEVRRAGRVLQALTGILVTEIKAELFETSSKTGQSVDELFQKVAEDYVHFSAFQVMTEEKGVDLGQRSSAYFYSCCHH